MDLSLDLLVHVFEHADGQRVLCSFALVCRGWRLASVEPELWRRLVARRFEALHALHGMVSADALVEPCTGSYDMQDVYFRIARMPTHLYRTSPALALSSPPGWPERMPTVATFSGEQLGGNQTVRANYPWASSLARGLHRSNTPDWFPSPPVGTLRAAMDGEAAPTGSRGRARAGSGSTRALRLCAELQMVHYFEVTILPAPAELRRGAAGEGAAPAYVHDRPCVAIGMCSSRFPLQGKMPGWCRHSFAYHGDDGCKFQNSSLGERYGPPFGEGDRVGCGVRLRPPYFPADEDVWTGGAFFTHNGQLLADPRLNLDGLSGAHLFACVGIDTYSPVRVNFGQEPFCFDVRAVLPLFEPAALGIPNPPDRSSYGACVKAHLRSTLRLPPARADADADGKRDSAEAALPPGAQHVDALLHAGIGPWLADWVQYEDFAAVPQINQLLALFAANANHHGAPELESGSSEGSGEFDDDDGEEFDDEDYESETGSEVEGEEDEGEESEGEEGDDEEGEELDSDWEMPNAVGVPLPETDAGVGGPSAAVPSGSGMPGAAEVTAAPS